MKSKIVLGLGFIGLGLIPNSSFALDQIIRPFQSVRSMGMGGTRITTGIYEDNFYNNPARVTANPQSKFTLFDITPIDINSNMMSVIGKITGGRDALTTISNSTGENLHERFELVLPAYYMTPSEERRLALSFGLLTSVQTDVDLRDNYSMNLGAVVDFGPALTMGYQFLEERNLSIGVTAHFNYRVSTDPTYSLLNYVSGTSPSISTLAGSGSMINFDLGASYLFTRLGDFNLTASFAIQNLMGGTFGKTIDPAKFSGSPMNQPRSFGLGIAAIRPVWWELENTVFAIEASDVLNNTDGSFFRLLHLGAETHFGKLAARLGLNQGYWSAGLGLDLHILTLNVATYGEEMGLNAGDLEDRRYAVNLGIHF
jgi:hypothetical protein